MNYVFTKEQEEKLLENIIAHAGLAGVDDFFKLHHKGLFKGVDKNRVKSKAQRLKD